MPRLKNIQHEEFARRYVVNGGIGAEAYRHASKVLGRKWTHPVTPRVMAFQFLQRPKIIKRIDELRNTMAKKADITVDKILTDFQEALAMAKERGQPNEIVTAAKAQAELVGLWKQRIETGSVADYESMESVDEILAKVESDMGLEAAQRLASALGVTWPKGEASQVQQTPPEASTEAEMPLADLKTPTDALN